MCKNPFDFGGKFLDQMYPDDESNLHMAGLHSLNEWVVAGGIPGSADHSASVGSHKLRKVEYGSSAAVVREKTPLDGVP